MDERARGKYYRINQEKFFLSVVIIAVFLIIKINMRVAFFAMLGEITAAAVILIYLIPYFIIRHKYEVVDEMVRLKLNKLSQVFFIVEMASMIPVLIIHLGFVFDIFSPSMHLIDSSFLFITSLVIITNAYGLIRTKSKT